MAGKPSRYCRGLRLPVGLRQRGLAIGCRRQGRHTMAGFHVGDYAGQVAMPGRRQSRHLTYMGTGRFWGEEDGTLSAATSRTWARA